MRTVTGLMALLAIAVSSAAWAADDTQIDGDLNIGASTGAVTTVAIGSGVTATTEIASLRGGSHIDGDATLRASVGAVTTVGLGAGNRVKAFLGSYVGGDTHGDVKTSFSGKNVSLVSFIPGKTVCFAGGSVRGQGGGSASANARVGSVVVVDFIPWRKTRINVGTIGRPC